MTGELTKPEHVHLIILHKVLHLGRAIAAAILLQRELDVVTYGTASLCEDEHPSRVQ